MNPFRYCRRVKPRKHDPRGYAEFRQYKAWLRDEFLFRCIYCLRREVWFPDGSDDFSVEHVVPKNQAKHLECSYSNLVYACRRCNSFKGEEDIGMHPRQVALGDLLEVDMQGRIGPRSGNRQGEFLIQVLRLDHPKLTEFRRRKIALLRQFALLKHADARIAVMVELGFPDDLPDLSHKAPPDGNGNGPSHLDSCFTRKAKNSLPRTYLCCGI